jgi:hypothetical protein
MPNWKKVIVSGSDASLNSLAVTTNVTAQTLTGSLYSTAVKISGSLQVTGSTSIQGDTGTTLLSTNADTIIFSGSFLSTGSITHTGRLDVLGGISATAGFTGSLLGTASNVEGGATNYIPLWLTPTKLSSSVIYQTGSTVVLNQTSFTTAAPEALYVWQPNTNSYNVISGKGNSNNYLQLNIQNTNQGANASSDIVATANNGDETNHYIDMGINSENFSGFLGGPNDAYLYSYGHNLWLGNAKEGYNVYFFNSSSLAPIVTLTDTGRIIMVGNTTITGSLTVTSGITGSLFGTSSWALNAVTASHAVTALSSSYALSASYAATASSADNFTVRGTLTAQTIVAQTITSSIEFVTGSTRFGSLLSNTHEFTGSVSVLGSFTSPNITGSLQGTASYALDSDKLDGRDSTTYANTGSNIFIGTQTVTGSLLTSGSNTLIGNTSLTGSFKISGSQTVTGYIQFEPVVTNIDNSISASYIYVSGSTQDLYFAQNSKGYSNTTRLRWLEGNLYTGLLNGGLITATVGSTTYQISSGSGIIVNLNASLNDNPYPTVQYLNWGNLTGNISAFTSSYQQVFVGIDSTNNIFAQGTPFSNGQFDTVINIGGVFFQNGSTINAVKTQPSVAYGFEQSQNIFNRAFGPLKLSGYTLAQSGSSTGSLVVGSGTAYAPGSNYAIDPNEPSYTVDNGTSISKIFRYYQSGSSWVYLTNAGAGYTVIDPTQYSNNGVLTAVPGGGSNRQWSIQRVFWFPNSVVKAIVVYYGNATYATEVEAIANISFESFVEAPNTAANAIYLGAIVVRNDADFTNTATFKIQPGGLFRQVGGSGGGGSIVTQTLAGLSDVSISGPTNLQPLVYSTTAGKWINFSAISASISGNANTATSASYSLSGSYALTSSYASSSLSASYALTASYVENAQSASYVLNAVSSSYALSSSNALTASYALNAGGISAIYIADEGVLQGTASYFNFTGSGVTTTVNNGTASVFIPGGGGGSGTGNTVLFTQASPATTWTFDHFLGGTYITYDIYDINGYAVIPQSAQVTGPDTLVVTFSTPSTGYIVATVGGGLPAISSSYANFILTVNQTGTSAQWVSASGLSVSSASYATTASHAFYSETASYVQNAQTASYVLSTVSASHALSASNFVITSTLALDGTLTDIATVNSSIGGSNNLFSQATGSYTSAFFKYTVANGANARSGEVIAVWNGTTTQYTDFSTTDIGNTSQVTASVAIVSSQVQFNMQTNTSGWRIKSMATFI